MYRMGLYIPGDTPVHRLDPRTKIWCVILLSLVVLRGQWLFSLILPTLFSVLIIRLSRVPLASIAQGMKPLRFFLLIFFAVHLFFTPGDPLPPFPIWDIAVTREGLIKGLVVSWQFSLLVFNGTLLTMTTSPSEFMCAIERALRPLKIKKVSSHDIALMISIALRFVPTLLMEIDRMKEAQEARGACFKGGSLRQRLGANVSLLVPLTLRTLNRADNLVTAMEARGYTREGRTYLTELRLRPLDYGVMLFMTAAAFTYLLKGPPIS